MIPVAHKVGPNMSKADFDALLTEFLTDRNIIKVAHNLSFEAMFSYAKGIVIMPPVYDTIAAAQMTLKMPTISVSCRIQALRNLPGNSVESRSLPFLR